MHGKQANAVSNDTENTNSSSSDNVEPLKSSDHNALQIIESMEQGVVVWSVDGRCTMFNERIFDVLELSPDDLSVGMERRKFLEMSAGRGEFPFSVVEKTERNFQRSAPFSFDRTLPSGRVIVSTSRPKASGGFVVTFTDVTEMRRKETELAEAKSLAEQAQTTAQNALADERSRKREARMLSELGEWLQSCKSLEELFDVISRFMAKLFPGSMGELYIYSNSRDVLDGSCSWKSETMKAHIQPDDCWALRRGRMYKFGAGSVNFTCNHANEIPADSESIRYLCLPIIAHGDTVGLLHIRFDRERDEEGALIPFDEGIHAFAIQCSEQISLAIANVKLRDELRDQSTKDPLTGLYNRRYFLERCRTEIGHAERYNQSIGLISIDADNFKMFNDNHGHDAGDVVLRTIADQMEILFDQNEVVSRFGGEEFSILLPNTSSEVAMQKAELLRGEVEQLVVRYGEKTLPKITISVGVAMYPGAGTTPLELLKSADEALYDAKDSGKNQVVMGKAEKPERLKHSGGK